MTSPVAALLSLRLFVLQQVPLKTTEELSVAFGAMLTAVVFATAMGSVVIAIRILRKSPLHNP